MVLWLQRLEPRAETICAFCFSTSAGVRMKQETSSAEEDAIELIMGVGREWVKGRMFLEESVLYLADALSTDFIASYVVKKAPAG